MESITLTELETINAGGWREAGKAFVGTLGIATGVGLSIASIACPPLIETGIGCIGAGAGAIASING
ncbi:hypothetical protein ACSXC4_17075 (plasmid) [Clostridium perfringens]|uniref:Bacteriocin n=3 Tax=Clostridium perfringens TaxID=1502 RepID=A0A140GPQ9_CLOPF|nr:MULTISPECIES: hypothetical protein [Clostridium]AMN30518.1 hypothetical protein JFP838_pE0012 [Clostridium perfringens]MDK7591398.1 hypothetical protein [Clostridium sp. UMB9555B]MDK7629691.1 hypothetical protein [Clostridium sp. UMB9555A]